MGEKWQGESGQSLVESAFVLPVLIFILLSMVEIGWVIYNRVTFDNMARVAVYSNSKTDDYQASQFLEKYIRRNFSRFDDRSLTVDATVEKRTYEYVEYVWKANQRKHWEVPMYFEFMRTSMEVSYELPYLTAFGKVIFRDIDNHLELTAKVMATRALENESIKWRDGGNGSI